MKPLDLKSFNKIAISIILFFVLLPAALFAQKKTINTKLPNVIIIIADDLGWNDVGYHDSEILTPNIDKLAKEGIELNRFYARHTCTPTRVGILTGKYPGRLGLTSGVIGPTRKEGINPEEYLLPEAMEELGYKRRACIGKWHVGHSHIKYHPINQGFTYFYGNYGGQVGYFDHKRKGHLDWHKNFDTSYDKGYSTFLLGNEAVEYIDESVKENEPFFMYLSFTAPHTPLQAPLEYLNKYGFDGRKGHFISKIDSTNVKFKNLKPTELGRGNNQRQTYCAMVTAMDDMVGSVLRSLAKNKISDNTIIVFLSDNGGYTGGGASNFPLRGRKGQTFEGGVRVPALIKYPAKLEGGQKLDGIVGYIDIMPTLMELIEKDKKIELPKIDGQSFVPLLTSEKYDTDREFYLGRFGLIQGKWKLAEDKMLFNLEEDLSESNDLSKIEPKIFNKMKKRLRELSAEIEIKGMHEQENGFRVRKEWKMPSK